MSVVGLPLVSVMPVAGLLPVLAAPVADCRWGRRHRGGFAAGVGGTGGK
jgi:hypothetical protein